MSGGSTGDTGADRCRRVAGVQVIQVQTGEVRVSGESTGDTGADRGR